MKVVLDAGAFVAAERGDRELRAMLTVFQQRRVSLRTSAAVVAQVWRDGRKQARIAQLLAGVSVGPLAPDNDRRTGELLARAHTDDVIDAHLALEVDEDDVVLTSDPDDLAHLLETRGVTASIVTV